jgi:tRNA U34 2-thiouridine synthase MnmA/TrmU
LETADIGADFLGLLNQPRYGFGANMNPCIDCKILMLKKARGLLDDYKADFIVTGEVLGQRPMSQHRQALELIEKKSGLEGLLLRPLSAKLLPETTPEKNGWISREKLLNIGGRSRRPQVNLARGFGIKDYPNAAGGCLLTDPKFSDRLKELIAHKELSLENIELLKIGRHFRISGQAKLVVARDEKEGKELENLARPGDCLFFPNDQLAGPTSLGRGEFNPDLINFSCSITCRYCDLNGAQEAEILINKEGASSFLKVSPISDTELKKFRI